MRKQGHFSRAVTLKGGGTVTIGVSMDPLRLSAEDRAFVFKLVDMLSAYEAQPASAVARTPGGNGPAAELSHGSGSV
jgi:hypothetical protein